MEAELLFLSMPYLVRTTRTYFDNFLDTELHPQLFVVLCLLMLLRSGLHCHLQGVKSISQGSSFGESLQDRLKRVIEPSQNRKAGFAST